MGQKTLIRLPEDFKLKGDTFYVVEIAVNSQNPIYVDVMYVPFVGRDNVPKNVSFSRTDIYYENTEYIKVLSTIKYSTENKYKLYREVLKESNPELLI